MTSLFPHLLCLLLLLLPLSTFSQTSCNSLSTLDANPYCSSPLGEFAFGFHPIQGEDHFLVAIWFAKIQVENIVWTANGGNPVQKGSKIELTSNGDLVLKAPNGTELWKAKPTDGTRATSAAMLDTGNFVLRSARSDINWQSFDAPTDTILVNQTLGLPSKLVSRRTKDDYSTGRFEFILQDDGNLVMYPLARPKDNNYGAYWASNTVGNGSAVVFNQSGYIYLNLKNGSQFSWTSERPVSTRDFYHRVTLDFDGVLRKYTYPKTSPRAGTESWSVAWFEPNNICTAGFGDVGSGVCGFNSYCKLDRDQRPECFCPFGYTYLDPDNKFKGCKQNFDPQSCGIDGSGITEGFDMREILNTDWPTSDYENFKAANEAWCSETCLNDCLCAVAIIRGEDCWFKKLPLSKGKMDTSVGGKALIKVGNSNSSSKCISQKEDKDNWILPGSILLGSSGFLNLLLILVICLAIFHGSYRKKQLRTQPSPSMIGVNLRSFTYKELEEATDGFKEELGRGAFSTVYKGVLESYTGSLVAVKKLDRLAEEIDKEFKNEVNSIGQTNHKNLAKLVGFCDEGTNRILVYEFMRNGSLASFLFGVSRPEWYRRIQIAFGIARGLTYLHEECSTQIIHCDVKPQNVLLDDAFVARISDFGLAKLLKTDQTRTSTGIRGTRGYVAPEWYKNMAITTKVDVYSFGIMLLEIICCRRNAEFELGNEDAVILSEWAYDCCVEGNLQLLVENDEGAKNDGRRLQRLIMVAIWCIQEDPSLRPTMRKVTQMLEGAVEVSMPPDPLSFISSIG